ncbi:hypothetical protein LOTGIDRAFT_237878 [Lottia gigantea]|uniref:Uncharacterized protein n=1 Tax=Lottia gigantea TaxID=225164 RepID=V4AF30_LOTGI|nr:hypothetical protein LOTGIDRAFT_237878 [Lottia gigantea]ESP02644.1 hypothetical protein LOTGIDRAFT_237878 [Lottia gigantea]
MATSHFPLKNCFLFGILFVVTKIYNASAQVTQPPPGIYEPPSIPLPRWPIELNGTQNGYHVLPDYVQQQIRQPSEIGHAHAHAHAHAHPPPPDSILRTESHKNPFRPQQPNTFNPHATKKVFKYEASWMGQQRSKYPIDRSIQEQGLNTRHQGPSNNPAYNNYPYKPQYPKESTQYEPKGPPFQKSHDSHLHSRIPTKFEHHTPAKVSQPQNDGYTYPKPPPGYYGPEKQETKPTAGLPQAILEYLQKQQAKDGLPPTLLNYLRSQAGAPVPQSFHERPTSAPPVDSSTESPHQAHQPNHSADIQHPLPQESTTESPSAGTTDQPTTPVIEFTTKAVASELMAKLSRQLESQSAAVQQLTDSFTTLSPLEASTGPTNNSDALSLQFRKLLLKKLIARRLLTLKTIGNLSKNTTTVAPVNISESVTATPNIQHHSAQEPATNPHSTSIDSHAPHISQGQENVHQQPLPATPTFQPHEHKTTEAFKDGTTTSSPGLLPGERFPPNSHYVGHLPPDAAADPHSNHANNQFQPQSGHRHSFNAQRPHTYEGNQHFDHQHQKHASPQNEAKNNIQTKQAPVSGNPEIRHAQRPNTYEGNQHFGNQHQGSVSPQNPARNNIQIKTASASGIPKISYVHSGQQNYLAGVSPKPDTATQNPQSYFHPASAQKELSMVTEPTPIFGAPNEMQTIEIPAMNNPTAKPGMVRVVYIPGKGGAKGFFRVIHVSAPDTSNPSTAQPLSPIQKYFSQDRINSQQYPTPEQLRHAIEQEKGIKDSSRLQHGSGIPKKNPVVESPQKFPAVDSTPLTGSQTNVKDSLVGLLNTLEPTKATKGKMTHYNQEKQAPNSWQNYATANDYAPNQNRFDPKYPTKQIHKHSGVTQQKVNKIQAPSQQYQEFTNVQQGHKKQGTEMSPSSPNLDPYYKLVEEQIHQNSIFTTAAPLKTSTSQTIQTQFGYNNVPYGAHGAPWESHYMSNGNQQNQGVKSEQIRQNSIFTTAAPLKTSTSQPIQTQFGYNNVPYGAPWESHYTSNGNQQNQGVKSEQIRQNSILTTAAPQATTTSQQNQAQFGYNNVPYGAPWERHHTFNGNQRNQGVIDARGPFNYPSRTQGPVVVTTEQPTTPVPIQNFETRGRLSAPNSNEFNMVNQQPKGPIPTGGRVPSDLAGAVRGASASVNVPGNPAFHGEHTQQTDIAGTSNLGPKEPAASTGSNTEVAIQDQLVQQTMMELLKRQPHLLQGNNLQELIQKLSQNISVPEIDNNYNLNKKASKSSAPSPSATATGSSSLQSSGSSIASPDVGLRRYPEPKAAPFENLPKTQPASSHPVPKQWNPVYSNGAQNRPSGHHRNMNQYHQEMHMGVYHYQGYEDPTTTTALPPTTQPLPVNSNNQPQYSGRYGPRGPQSRYPIRGPQMNFPIPIYEHTVLDKPKPQLKPPQSKPVVQTPSESNYWKQQQQNHTVQHQNYWQQPPQAANNQQQNQSIGQHSNHWQQQHNQSSGQHSNHWQQQQNRYEQQHRGSPHQNQIYQQQNSTRQHQQNAWQQQQNQTNQYQPYWQTQQNQTNPNYWQAQHNQTNHQQAHQQYPRNQYQTHNNQPQQQYYPTNQYKHMHSQHSNQQAPASPQQNKHTAYLSGELHRSHSSVVEAKPLQIQIPGNINLGAPQSSMTAGGYPVAQVQLGQTTSSALVDTLSLQRSPLVDPVSPSGGVPDLTAGLPKDIIVSFPGGGVSPGSDVLGILDPMLLSGGNPSHLAPVPEPSSSPAPSTSTAAPNTTTAMPTVPTTTIPPAHTFSSEQMCTMQSECEMGCCYTLQGDILWDWKFMVEPPQLPQVGYCHTKMSTELGDGCEASFCPCVSANQVCLSVPPENFTIPAGYDAAEQGAISFGKCMSTAQKKAAVSHMTQAKMLVDMCMSDPSCPLHSMQLQKKKKK